MSENTLESVPLGHLKEKARYGVNFALSNVPQHPTVPSTTTRKPPAPLRHRDSPSRLPTSLALRAGGGGPIGWFPPLYLRR